MYDAYESDLARDGRRDWLRIVNQGFSTGGLRTPWRSLVISKKSVRFRWRLSAYHSARYAEWGSCICRESQRYHHVFNCHLMFPYRCIFIVLRSLRIGPSGVPEFGNKILNVKNVVGLLRRGIGLLTTEAQHTKHGKEIKWVYRVTEKILDTLCCCLQCQVTFSVTQYIHTKKRGSNTQSWYCSDPKPWAYSISMPL